MKFPENIKVNIIPSKSHVILVAMLLIDIIPLVYGFRMLESNNKNWWIPLSLGVLIIIFICIAWIKSFKNIDMENQSPTTLKDNVGNIITTDSRLLANPKDIEKLGNILSTLTNRKPVPKNRRPN